MKSHTIAATKHLELERCIHATDGYAFFRLINHNTGNVHYPKIVNTIMHGIEVRSEDSTPIGEHLFTVKKLLEYRYL